MEGKFERLKNYFFSSASRFFKYYKKYLLVFFIVFLFGFCTGIFTSSGYSSDLAVDNLINKYLYSNLSNEMSFFSYYLTLLIFLIIAIIFTMFLVRNKFMVCANIFLLFIMAYIFGFDLCVIVVCLGLSGVIFGVLFYGILGIIVFALYICIMAISSKNAIAKDKCNNSFKEILHENMPFILFAIIVLFASCLLFSIIHIFVIVE